MDLARPDVPDNRRLEIVAEGLPLFHGAQLAIDTTVVSVLKRDGTPHTRCADVDGAALQAAAEGDHLSRAGWPKIPSWVASSAGRGWSCWGVRWPAGGQTNASVSCASWQGAKVRSEPPHLKVRARRAWLSRWSVLLSCSARAVDVLLR